MLFPCWARTYSVFMIRNVMIQERHLRRPQSRGVLNRPFGNIKTNHIFLNSVERKGALLFWMWGEFFVFFCEIFWENFLFYWNKKKSSTIFPSNRKRFAPRPIVRDGKRRIVFLSCFSLLRVFLSISTRGWHHHSHTNKDTKMVKTFFFFFTRGSEKSD